MPAQTVVQALPGDGQRLQHLLQAVVSAKKMGENKHFSSPVTAIRVILVLLQDGCINQVIVGIKR